MGRRRFARVGPVLVIAVIVAMGSMAVPALAEDKKVNVAVLDVAAVFEKYAMTRDLEAQFDERRKAAAAEAESKRANLEAKRKSLVTFKPESKEFADLQVSLIEMESEYEVWAAVQEKKLKAEHKQWLLRIYKKVREVTGEVAKRGGIDLVMTYNPLAEDAPDSMALRQQILLQSVLFFDERIDLTQAVLTELNQKYEKEGGAGSLRLGLGGSPPARDEGVAAITEDLAFTASGRLE